MRRCSARPYPLDDVVKVPKTRARWPVIAHQARFRCIRSMNFEYTGFKFLPKASQEEAKPLDSTSFLDLAFMLVATVLTLFSVNTLQILARIGLEKSLFIPVMVSAVFFWCGSIVSVVFPLCAENAPQLLAAQDSINLLHQTTLLIGLSILTYGVYSYWRITRNVKLPKHERRQKQNEDRQELAQQSPTVE